MIIRKKDCDWKKTRRQFTLWLKDNAYYYGLEWPYKNMKSCLLAEKVLYDPNPIGLMDYKFFCFEGEPKMLSLDIGVCNEDGSHAESYYRNFYDMDFKPLNIKETRDHYNLELMKKPPRFNEMVDIARKLSMPFPHCRVDLYNVEGKIYFGEITFYHGSGYNDFQPLEADLMIGGWIKTDLHSNYYLEKSEVTFRKYRKVSLNKF